MVGKMKLQLKHSLRIAATALLLTGIALPATTLPATAATSVIQINDDVVRLGQIFHGIGAKADTIVGAAPQPGKDVTLSARKLLQLAKTNGLKWQPSSGDDQVILRRVATGVGIEAQMEALKTALAAKGAGEQFELVFAKPLAPMNLAADALATVTVDGLMYDPVTSGFTATLLAGGRRVAVAGTVNRLVSLPVLKEPLQKGQMISASDLSYTTVSAMTLTKGSMTDADGLIGMVATRTLEPGKPLRSSDVDAQRLVTRGQDIDIIFATGPMQLRARGKAMQNGTSDDLVKVVNLSSNKSFDARVTGDGEVTVY